MRELICRWLDHRWDKLVLRKQSATEWLVPQENADCLRCGMSKRGKLYERLAPPRSAVSGVVHRILPGAHAVASR